MAFSVVPRPSPFFIGDAMVLRVSGWWSGGVLFWEGGGGERGNLEVVGGEEGEFGERRERTGVQVMMSGM